MALVIGLDLGTTSISAVVFDTQRGAVVHSAECANSGDVAGLKEFCHEQCPETIFEAACGLVGSVVRASGVPPKEIKGLALTGQQHGLVIVDEGLNPLTHLMTWQDQRTAAEPDGLRKHHHAAETGCFLHPGYGGLTLHHLIHTGGLPKGAYKALSITGFLAARLTGRCSIDETMAASWGILDVKSGGWHQTLLKLLDIPEGLLPEIVPSCSSLGPVARAGLTGLNAQTMVWSPVGDNQAGFASVANPGGREAVINLGTSAQISVLRPDFSFSPRLETRPFPGGGFLRVYAALCGGWAYSYLAGFFQQIAAQIGGVTLSLAEVFDHMQAFATTTDADGLWADVRIAGERNGGTPGGSIGGIGPANFTPANLVRAFANGIATELASAAGELQLDHVKSLAIIGNAAYRNPLLVKALENKFGLPCRVVASGQEAALGAARLASRLGTSSRP